MVSGGRLTENFVGEATESADLDDECTIKMRKVSSAFFHGQNPYLLTSTSRKIIA